MISRFAERYKVNRGSVDALDEMYIRGNKVKAKADDNKQKKDLDLKMSGTKINSPVIAPEIFKVGETDSPMLSRPSTSPQEGVIQSTQEIFNNYSKHYSLFSMPKKYSRNILKLL